MYSNSHEDTSTVIYWYVHTYTCLEKKVYTTSKKVYTPMKIKGIYFLKNQEHNSLIAKQYILLWREVVYIVYSKSSSMFARNIYLPVWFWAVCLFEIVQYVCKKYIPFTEFEQYVYSKLCSMFARSIYLSLWIWAVCLFKTVQYVGKKHIPFNLNLNSMFIWSYYTYHHTTIKNQAVFVLPNKSHARVISSPKHKLSWWIRSLFWGVSSLTKCMQSH
jgi:hypothetical protein